MAVVAFANPHFDYYVLARDKIMVGVGQSQISQECVKLVPKFDKLMVQLELSAKIAQFFFVHIAVRQRPDSIRLNSTGQKMIPMNDAFL